MLSEEHEANISELNWVMHNTAFLCSLIIKSVWYVISLYIIIEKSHEPDINLPSFKTDKQYIHVYLIYE